MKPQSYERSRNGKTQIYGPPLGEFDVLQIELKAGENETLGAVGGPGILLATEDNALLKAAGKTYDATEGSVFFITQGTELELHSENGAFMHAAIVEGQTK